MRRGGTARRLSPTLGASADAASDGGALRGLERVALPRLGSHERSRSKLSVDVTLAPRAERVRSRHTSPSGTFSDIAAAISPRAEPAAPAGAALSPVAAAAGGGESPARPAHRLPSLSLSRGGLGGGATGGGSSAPPSPAGARRLSGSFSASASPSPSPSPAAPSPGPSPSPSPSQRGRPLLSPLRASDADGATNLSAADGSAGEARGSLAAPEPAPARRVVSRAHRQLKRAMVAVRAAQRLLRLQKLRRGGTRLREGAVERFQLNGPLREADALALSADRATEATLAGLANYLTRDAVTNTDLKRARAIFRWVTNNVRFAEDATLLHATAQAIKHQHARGKASHVQLVRGQLVLDSDDDSDDARASATRTLALRVANSLGFARLFQALAAEAGLRCVRISGFFKRVHHSLGAAYDDVLHHWNAVEADGRWRVVDAYASAGVMAGGRFVKEFSDTYFDAAPEAFLADHFPTAAHGGAGCVDGDTLAAFAADDARLQFTSQRITRSEFDSGLRPHRAYLALGVEAITPATHSVQHGTPYYSLSLVVPVGVDLSVAMRHQGGLRKSLERCWHRQSHRCDALAGSLAHKMSLHLVFPRSGRYDVTVLGCRLDAGVQQPQPLLEFSISTTTGLFDIPSRRSVYLGFVQQQRVHAERERAFAAQVCLLEPLQGYFDLGLPVAVRLRAPRDTQAVVIASNGTWVRLRAAPVEQRDEAAAAPQRVSSVARRAVAVALAAVSDGADSVSGSAGAGDARAASPAPEPQPSPASASASGSVAAAAEGQGAEGAGGDAMRGSAALERAARYAAMQEGEEDADGAAGEADGPRSRLFEGSIMLARFPELLVFVKRAGNTQWSLHSAYRHSLDPDPDGARAEVLAVLDDAGGDAPSAQNAAIAAAQAQAATAASAATQRVLTPEQQREWAGRVVLDTWGRCFESNVRIDENSIRCGNRTCSFSITAPLSVALRVSAKVGPTQQGAALPEGSCSIEVQHEFAPTPEPDDQPMALLRARSGNMGLALTQYVRNYQASERTERAPAGGAAKRSTLRRTFTGREREELAAPPKEGTRTWRALVKVPAPGCYTVVVTASSSGYGGLFRFAFSYNYLAAE